MCLYVEGSGILLDSGSRRARKEHTCEECRRKIAPGEQYRFWILVESEFYDGLYVEKMCAHCWGTIELGAALTGCPKQWNWGEIHEANDPYIGFVANVLHDEEHHLDDNQRRRMLRTVDGRRRGWRGIHGRLLPIPAPRPDDPHYTAEVAA